jgi:SAM-dependent methyltransferase
VRDLLAHWQYRRVQVRQSRAKRAKDASFRLIPFVRRVAEIPDLRVTDRILCLGPRNTVELDLFRTHGFINVAALDLWSDSSRIEVGDMHGLPYADQSVRLVFASHVFEHAYHFETVAAEVTRVLYPGGYVFAAVPINFVPSEHDRYDFQDAAGLLRYFPGASLIEEHHWRANELVVLFRVARAGAV